MNVNKALFAVLALPGAFVLWLEYDAWTLHVGEERAASVCSAVKVGQPTKGLLEQAIAAGADARWTHWMHGDPDILVVSFPSADPIERHECWITARDGRVASAETYFHD